MRVVMLTNEYPPAVYGGAGVHVVELTNALRGRVELDIRTFGDQRHRRAGWRVRGYPVSMDLDAAPGTLRPVLGAFSRNLAMSADPIEADLVHCHTWYTHLGGVVIAQAANVPLVVTVHSLEPLRPWKREQLGGGYELSAWVERQAMHQADAVIAVSRPPARTCSTTSRPIRSGSTSSPTASTPPRSRRTGRAPTGPVGRRPTQAVRPVRGPRDPSEGDREPGRGHSQPDRGHRCRPRCRAAGHARAGGRGGTGDCRR